MDVMLQTACFVINQITVNNSPHLFITDRSKVSVSVVVYSINCRYSSFFRFFVFCFFFFLFFLFYLG